MHAWRHVILATDLVCLRPEASSGRAPDRGGAHWDYWCAARIRTAEWTRVLADAERQSDDSWNGDLTEVAEEFFLADALARVWLGWLRRRAVDKVNEWAEWEAVASSVWQGHNDFRGRLLRRLVAAGDRPSNLVLRLDRVRRRAERWTDMLLGVLASTGDHAAQLADLWLDPAAGREIRGAGVRPAGVTCQAVRDAVRRLYEHRVEPAAVRGRCSRRIVRSVLGAVGAWDADVMYQLAQFWDERMVVGAEQLADWLDACDESSALPAAPRPDDPGDRSAIDA